MVKATLHLINKYSYISIIYCCLVSCAIIKDSPQFVKTNGFKSERIESVKAHYGRVLQKFLNQKNMRRVPALHLKYLNSLIKTSKVFIKEVIVVKDSNSKYRPGWIEDAQGWAGENNEDVKTNWFYSNET